MGHTPIKQKKAKPLPAHILSREEIEQIKAGGVKMEPAKFAGKAIADKKGKGFTVKK